MAELENLGYLEQPHTSAGRIPSNLGYRMYVDELMNSHKLSAKEMETINNALNRKIRELDFLIAEAGKLPLPDDLMGELMEYVVKHEVGHTLGLMHNFKASAMYPQEKLRDPKWIHQMGHCPSIMDYSRFNYVAQPEDHIPVEDLIPGIGPYDKWAIHWGYATIPGAKTPEEEKSQLDAWAREQDTTPHLRFADDYAAMKYSDPSVETEAVGDADPVK
jgi:hypothetical protein